MKNKFLSITCGLLLVGTLTGCGNSSSTNFDNKPGEKDSGKLKFNCSAVECIEQIKPENTVEEINDIIGSDGELTDEKYSTYYWKISEDTGVEVSYYIENEGTIKIDYNRDDLENNKVDFSKYEDLKSKIKKGIKYEEFISYIGGVEGTVIEKSTSTTQYIWVDKEGSYLQATFSKRTGFCTTSM